MGQLATFAWTWVSTAAPEWLVPLASRLASSWCWSVDQSMGLFCGAEWDTPDTGEGEQ